MTDKQSTHRKDLKDELQAIYQQKDGELPDLTKLERTQTSSLTSLLLKLVVGLSVIAAIAWGGFFIWTQGVFQKNDTLVTSIEGPEDVLAGEEVFYAIRYTNTGDVPLASLEMKLNLPFGFEITSSSPAPTTDQTWTIGSVSPGTDGSVVISGIFRTEVPTSHSLQAFFTYRPANFSSDFEDIETLAVNVSGSILSLTLSGPEKALPGDDVRYIVNVQNSGRTPTEQIQVSLEFPADFTISTSDPSPTEEDTPVWIIDALRPGELVALTLDGSFSSSVSGEQTLRAITSLLDPEGVALTQAQSEMITDILGGGVSFSMIVDGSTTSTTADLSDRLRVSIDYANNSEDAVGEFALVLNLTSPNGKPLPIDWETAELGSGARTENTITWDSSVEELFSQLDPSTSGVIDVTLPLLDSIDLSAFSDVLTLRLSGSMQKIGAVESPRTIDATPITVTLNSNLESTVEARYYTQDGEALGTGPLPPRVGEPTSYRIFWKLDNSLHALENILVTATLPPDVLWKDRTESNIGTLTFNETTRLVSWKIDKLPTDLSQATANFEIVITPNENDVGSFFKLTNATSVSAKDSVSGGSLSTASDVLTTELATDEFAKGKGVVEE